MKKRAIIILKLLLIFSILSSSIPLTQDHSSLDYFANESEDTEEEEEENEELAA